MNIGSLHKNGIRAEIYSSSHVATMDPRVDFAFWHSFKTQLFATACRHSFSRPVTMNGTQFFLSWHMSLFLIYCAVSYCL